MINRLPPEPSEIGQEIIDGAMRFKIEAMVFGGELSLEYTVEGRIPMKEANAQGKAMKFVRTMLAALAEKEDRDDDD